MPASPPRALPGKAASQSETATIGHNGGPPVDTSVLALAGYTAESKLLADIGLTPRQWARYRAEGRDPKGRVVLSRRGFYPTDNIPVWLRWLAEQQAKGRTAPPRRRARRR
jgi:hypothetical protein